MAGSASARSAPRTVCAVALSIAGVHGFGCHAVPASPALQSVTLRDENPVACGSARIHGAAGILFRPSVSGFYYYRWLMASHRDADGRTLRYRNHSNMPMKDWPAFFAPAGSEVWIPIDALYEDWRTGPTASSGIPAFEELPAGSVLTLGMEYVPSETWPVANRLIGAGTEFAIEVVL